MAKIKKELNAVLNSITEGAAKETDHRSANDVLTKIYNALSGESKQPHDFKGKADIIAGISKHAQGGGGGGTPFQITTEEVTVQNGLFSVSYEGELPNNMTSSCAAVAIITNEQLGVKTGSTDGSLNYALTADQSNKSISFRLQGSAPDGVLSATGKCIFAVVNTMTGEPIYLFPITVYDLPVKYDARLEQGVGNYEESQENWTIEDFTIDNTLDLTPFIYPQNVTPSAEVEYHAAIFSNPNGTSTELEVVNNTVTLPANTLQTGEEGTLIVGAGSDLFYYTSSICLTVKEP